MRHRFIVLAICLVASGVAATAQDDMPKQPKFLVVKGIQEDANYVLQAKNPDEVLQQEKIDDYDYKSIDAVQERAANCLQKIKQLFDGGTLETEEIEVVTGKTTVGEL